MENNELQDFIKCFIDNFLSLINLQQSTFKEITKELKKEEEQKNDSINNN